MTDEMIGFTFGSIVGPCIFAWAGYAVAEAKNRNRWLWLVLCLFFIPLVILACMPKLPGAQGPQGRPSAPSDWADIETLFRTSRGAVAALKDGRVIAEVSGRFKAFDGIVDYRRAYDDRETWPEVADPSEKRQFFIAARAAMTPPGVPPPAGVT